MAFQRNDYLSLNRGGTPGTAGGATGAYYVEQIAELEMAIGVPLKSDFSGAVPAPGAGGPHSYIDDSVSPAVLYIWSPGLATFIPLAVGISANAGNVLTLGTDGKPMLDPDDVAGVFRDCANNPHAANAQLPTCTEMNDAIADAIAALPGDKFLQGLQSYNAATNTLTLLMNDASTVTIDMTALLADAIAPSTDAGNVYQLGTDGKPFVPCVAWMCAGVAP